MQGANFQLDKEPLLNIPIKQGEGENEIISNVNEIINQKRENPQADTSALENKIDFLVYHLYDLTYDEVLVVDSNPPFSREEYDAYQVEQ